MIKMDRQTRFSQAGIKMFVMVILGIAFYLARYSTWLSAIQPLGMNPDKFCLFDVTHHYLEFENIAVREYKSLGYGMELLSSVFIDCSFIYACLIFITQAQTIRLLYAIICFYGTRYVLQVDESNLGNFHFHNPGRFLLANSLGSFAYRSLRYSLGFLFQWPQRVFDANFNRSAQARQELSPGWVDRSSSGLRYFHPASLPSPLFDR